MDDNEGKPDISGICNEISFHRAVSAGNPKAVKLLLNKEMVDIEAKSAGLTPLHLAVKLFVDYERTHEYCMNASLEKPALFDIPRCKCQDDVVSIVPCSTMTMDTTDATKTDTSGTCSHERAIANKGKKKKKKKTDTSSREVVAPGTWPSGIKTRGEELEEIVKLLLYHGADVYARNADGKSVLEVAVEERPSKVTEHCLSIAITSAKRKDRGAVDLVGYGLERFGTEYVDLLYNAVINGHTKILEHLLKLGADTEMRLKVPNGGTLLHLAADQRQVKIAELLVEHGANVNAKNEMGTTPILYAVRNTDHDMTELFVTNGANDEGRHRVLHTAAASGCIYIMKMILEQMSGINVNAVDNDVDGVLSFSTAYICHDPFVTSGDLISQQRTALHVAATKGSTRVVEMLLLKGAEVDAKQGDGMTPLHLAVIYGNAKVFKLLIEHGADVHKRDNGGLNLVHMASKYGRLKMFEEDLLDVIKAGHPPDNCGLMALQYAIRQGSSADVEILLKHGAHAFIPDENYSTLLHDATRDTTGRIVEALLNSLDIIDTNGYTALHKAADEGNLAAVRVLLFHGWDVNIKDTSGRTPVEILIRNTHFPRPSRLPFDAQSLSIFAEVPEIDMQGMTDEESECEHMKEMIKIARLNWDETRMIEEHFVKMMALGPYVDCYNRRYIDMQSFHKSMFAKMCIREIEMMKRTRIGSSSVSFYEFLTADKPQLARYSKDRSIAEVLERDDQWHIFVFYRDMIDLRFRKSKVINKL